MKNKIIALTAVVGLSVLAGNARDIQEYFQPELKEARLVEEAEFTARMDKEQALFEEKYFNSDEYKAEQHARKVKTGKNKLASKCEMIGRSAAIYGAEFDLIREAVATEFNHGGETHLMYRTSFKIKNGFGVQRNASLSCRSDIEGNVYLVQVDGDIVLDTKADLK